MALSSVKDIAKDIWLILKKSFSGFRKDRGLKLSAALAYYTVFSLAPLLVLVIYMAGFLLGDNAVQSQLFSQINEIIGSEPTRQLQNMINNLKITGKSNTALVTGITTLLVGSTTVFVEIQTSINMIWRIKAKPERDWLKLIKDRLLSFSLVISLGFLLLASLIINGLVAAFSTNLADSFPQLTVLLVNGINLLLGFLVIGLLFGIIFKFLPDAEVTWREVGWGAFFTATLFMLGRYLISLYIRTADINSTYGAAGSLMVLLVWIYFTAVILYFGAEFTQAYADHIGSRIRPEAYAVHVRQEEVEEDVKELPRKDVDAEQGKKPGKSKT
ncbi:YihY/virulence factor BrkB family protein [Nibrella viscosa]|uniref:YihY/virulence factor BrkB family protein n=1 Tax=Nibrella viscosa TaxID=1084524 RepID=A0ABP8KRJ1_9BACT